MAAYAFDQTLEVQVRRTVGHRAVCSCGRRSRVCATVRKARQELAAAHVPAAAG